MKKQYFAIHLIVLAMFVFPLNSFVMAQPSNEQIEAFRFGKTVRILVDQSYQSYGKIIEVSLPFEDVARKLLEYAGYRVVMPDDKDFDLKLMIEAKEEARAASYSYGVGSSRTGTFYTGASLSGFISLSIQGIPDYKKSFSGFMPRPLQIKNVSRLDYANPSDAPFNEAFKEPRSFLFTIMEMLGEIFDSDCIIKALQDNNKDIRINASEVLGKRKDPLAVEPLIAILKDNTGPCGTKQ